VKTLLSTKKLTLPQKDLLLNSGISLVEYNAISIEYLPFYTPEKIKNAIFTSQNAVHSFFQNKSNKTQIEQVFCVGDKTRALLVENGQNVVKNEQNASNLANFIKESYKNEKFCFFCGNLKSDAIIEISKTSKNVVFEVKTYQNELKMKHFDQTFNGIMFFSPSGVLSFTSENNMAKTTAFCIGGTTASEAKKHTNTIIIANSATIESVIAKVVKTFKEND